METMPLADIQEYWSTNNKLTKWSIRIYTLADSNMGNICGIILYYGIFTTEKLIRPNLLVSTRIRLYLYTMLLKKIPNAQGHHMFTDRYYTNYTLAEELRKLKCHLTGTILTNKKNLPQLIKKSKFCNKSTIAYQKSNTLVIAWKDKNVVT
ncbi:piggyBac transposable element-derived protein 4-like [Vespula squamosa]|uniref:PiggyBac transposable element-derived protein 4-like n=1 Tax=Vespula squamosa TaxID=30214 RepID=A0ABD2BZF9_VESSQ